MTGRILYEVTDPASAASDDLLKFALARSASWFADVWCARCRGPIGLDETGFEVWGLDGGYRFLCFECRVVRARRMSEVFADVSRHGAIERPNSYVGYGRIHRLYRRWFQERVLNRFGVGWCMERICFAPSRIIQHREDWHLAHDRLTGGYLGPAHSVCNLLERHNRRDLLGFSN